MHARIENGLLVVATIGIVAFLVSFGLGVRRPAPTADGMSPDSIAAYDYLNRGRATRVEVLNGAGRSGLARAATDRLRDAGYDVVFFGNADSPTDTSYVLDRLGHIDAARAVGRALGIERVRTAMDSTMFLEATVVLGKDFEAGVQE